MRYSFASKTKDAKVTYMSVALKSCIPTYQDTVLDFYMLLVLWIIVIGQSPGTIDKEGPWLQDPAHLLVDCHWITGMAGGLKGISSIKSVVLKFHIAKVALHAS